MREELSSEEILVFREPRDGTETLSNSWISIDIDPKLTANLIEEGLAREIINRIQKTRKDLNLNVEDRIIISVSGDSEIITAANNFKEHISSETLCSSFVTTQINQPHVFDIDGTLLS